MARGGQTTEQETDKQELEKETGVGIKGRRTKGRKK